MLKIFTKNTSSLNYKYALALGFILVSLISLILGVKVIKYYQSINSGAASNTANIFVQPAVATVSGTTSFQVWSTSGNPTGFAATEIGFDRTKLKLANEVDVSTSPLHRIVKVTTMADANTTGKVTLVLGLAPANVSTPPNGTFLLAKINFLPNTTNQNISTNVTVNNSATQVVGTDTANFTITSAPSTVTVNPGTVGDINNDGSVNILDYTLLSNAMGTSNTSSDLNHDGIVNILDYTILSNNFGS